LKFPAKLFHREPPIGWPEFFATCLHSWAPVHSVPLTTTHDGTKAFEKCHPKCRGGKMSFGVVDFVAEYWARRAAFAESVVDHVAISVVIVVLGTLGKARGTGYDTAMILQQHDVVAARRCSSAAVDLVNAVRSFALLSAATWMTNALKVLFARVAACVCASANPSRKWHRFHYAATSASHVV
jgi:hypothetical protein